MPVEAFTNNAVDTTLTADITSGATTMTLTSVVGWPTTGQWRALLKDATKAEVVLCTPNSGATYNIQRAVESLVGPDGSVYSTAQSFAAASTTVHHFVTGGAINTKVAKTGDTMTGNLLLNPGAAIRDPFGWQWRNEQQVRLALGWGNGGQPSTVPRSRQFTAFDFDFVDLVPWNANAKQFQMAFNDGRRVMFLPFGTFYNPLGTLAAYDPSKPFATQSSWEFADLPTITGDPQAQGFLGAVADLNGWLYFCPCIVPGGTGVTLGPNKAFRFNTARELSESPAYEAFDFSTIPGGQGGPPTPYYSWQSMVCDGRWIYYIPCTKQNTAVITNVTNTNNPTVTTQSASGFAVGDSVLHANIAGLTGVNGSFTIVSTPTPTTYTITATVTGTYTGGGQASIFTPHGQIMRFDTKGAAGGFASNFLNPANWEVFDMKANLNTNAVALLGAAWNGSYIYMAPFATAAGSPTNGLLIRFDPSNPAGFRNAASYSTVDLEAMLSPAANFTTANNAGRAVGFCGLITIGPYLMLVPFGGGAGLAGGTTFQRSLTVLYDTRMPLSDPASYRTFDLRTIERKKYAITAVANTVNPLITVTLPTGVTSHGYTIGQWVNISGITPTGNGANKTLQVATTPSATTFTVTLGTSPGTYTSGGNVTSGADECLGYQFGFFDGQYVHLTPSYNSARTSPDCVCPPYARWDTRLPFDEASSWSYVNTPLQGVFAIPAACTGATTDGRFGYHAPYTGNTATYAPVIRVDCGAPNLAGMVDPLPDLYRGPSMVADRYPPTEDDFVGGGTTSLAIGNLGWLLQTTGTGGSVAPKAPELGHDGILTLTTGATNGGANGLALMTSATVGPIFLNGQTAKPFDITWIIRTLAPATKPIYRIGLTDAISSAQPANGIYLESLTADTAWFIVIRAASAQARITTFEALANNTWYKIRLKWDPPYMKFAINGRALQAYGTPNQLAGLWYNVAAPPAMPTAGLAPMVSLTPGAAASVSMDVDDFKMFFPSTTRV
jgi:hypothetical protein